MTLYEGISTFIIAIIFVAVVYLAGMIFIEKLGEWLNRWFRGWY